MKNLFLLISVLLFLPIISCKKSADKSGDKTAESIDAAPIRAPKRIEQTLPIDISRSVVNWEGSNIDRTINGGFRLSSGEISRSGNMITGGSFVIDMKSLTTTNLKAGEKTKFENHLKGFIEGKADDFFDVNKFPTGRFDITRVTKVNGDETATHLIYGNLTMKGVTNEIGFKALVGIGKDRIEVTTPAFTIDRTKWGINYGSKSVLGDLGDSIINDEVVVTISLKARIEQM